MEHTVKPKVWRYPVIIYPYGFGLFEVFEITDNLNPLTAGKLEYTMCIDGTYIYRTFSLFTTQEALNMYLNDFTCTDLVEYVNI